MSSSARKLLSRIGGSVRRALLVAVVLMVGLDVPSRGLAQQGELKVEIFRPASGLLHYTGGERVRVEGGASVFGGVRELDLFLVIDTSQSLKRSDRENHRVAGASALVRGFPEWSDIQLGVVEFNHRSELTVPLTSDRQAVIEAVQGLDRKGRTNIAKGLRTALEGFETGARPQSTRAILLFTDGKSDEEEALEAAELARERGVAVHTLLLGSDEEGAAMLRNVAERTGGSFVQVEDPAQLPAAFMSLRTTGIKGVDLRLNGGDPVPAVLVGGSFATELELPPGANRIVASATSLDGRESSHSIELFVSGPLELHIDAPEDGAVYGAADVVVAVEGRVTVFLGLAQEELRDPSQGIRSVLLRSGDDSPVVASVSGGRFHGRVLAGRGENRIAVTATSFDGRVRDEEVRVTLRAPGCGTLVTRAERVGEPALSISDRGVEVVLDASNSMWGRLDGTPKIEIAKAVLQDALRTLPPDVALALRAYGHRQPRERRDCTDSELLVPLASGERAAIRQAIDEIKPRGQTPLALSIREAGADFADFPGERAVVLVTDGIESCGGDPAREARDIHDRMRLPVHVIGFGIGSNADEDADALRSIADASGGQFFLASNAEELREALKATVGTRFSVQRDGKPVASGVLGSDAPIRLPDGEYILEFESHPPQSVPIRVIGEEELTVKMLRERDQISSHLVRRPVDYTSCEDIERAWAAAAPAPSVVEPESATTPRPDAPPAKSSGPS